VNSIVHKPRSLALALIMAATALWCVNLTAGPTGPALAGASASAAGNAKGTLANQISATVAKVITFIANANLRVTKNQGSELDAQGPVTGTVDGYLKLKVNISSASRMTSRFVASSSKGSIEGTAVSEYGVSGNTVYYTGVANITHGTGAYVHVNARGVHEEGSMDRKRKLGQMHISGHGSI
jgi:hypothetical protein